mgnify:CR=1 FL=1
MFKEYKDVNLKKLKILIIEIICIIYCLGLVILKTKIFMFQKK